MFAQKGYLLKTGQPVKSATGAIVERPCFAREYLSVKTVSSYVRSRYLNIGLPFFKLIFRQVQPLLRNADLVLSKNPTVQVFTVRFGDY